MNVRDLARRDWRSLLQSSFDLDITITAPNSETATIKGLGTRITQEYDTDGQSIIGELTSVTINEAELSEANPAYPIRDTKGLVALNDHIVKFLDSQDVERSYKVKIVYPNNTVGIIRMECADYKPSP